MRAHRARELCLLGRLVLGAEVYVGFLLLGVPLSPVEALIFASVPIPIAVVRSRPRT